MSLSADISVSDHQAKLAIEVKNLSWRVEKCDILSQLSFGVREGEMLGIIGPNGAGKSSLLRCLYRYIQPSSGVISVFGEDITRFSANQFAKQVAVVLQDTPPHFDLTTEQLVTIGLTPHKGMFDKINIEDKTVISEALEQVGLSSHKAQQQFEHLSGGEKQRALIARALVQRPKLLILDEPTNHLDIRYQIQIMELLRSVGITIITTIHDLNIASAMCDRLLLLEQGRGIAHGSPSAVLTETLISKVFGVSCSVAPHPQHAGPQISYYFGCDNRDYGESAHLNQNMGVNLGAIQDE